MNSKVDRMYNGLTIVSRYYSFVGNKDMIRMILVAKQIKREYDLWAILINVLVQNISHLLLLAAMVLDYICSLTAVDVFNSELFF
jgi:hypothetical protein